MAVDYTEALRANPVAKLLTQIEQNTRSERTAVYYKTRQDLGAKKVCALYFAKRSFISGDSRTTGYRDSFIQLVFDF